MQNSHSGDQYQQLKLKAKYVGNLRSKPETLNPHLRALYSYISHGAGIDTHAAWVDARAA